MTHPYKCDACETTIRATNVEWLFDDGENGEVVHTNRVSFSSFRRTDDKEQLYYCPNDDCNVERLTPPPGDSE